MAEGGANYNATDSMLTENPAVRIQPFSGGGYEAIEEVEREMYEGDREGEIETMEGGARGIVEGFEPMPNAQELSNLMFALGLAIKNTFGKNKIDEAQAELLLNKFNNINFELLNDELKTYRISGLPVGQGSPLSLVGSEDEEEGDAVVQAPVVQAPVVPAAVTQEGLPFEINVRTGGGYKGGALNFSSFGEFMQLFNTFLKQFSFNYSNFLFLYDKTDGFLPDEQIPQFIKALKSYLEEAVKAGKLPDWQKYSKDATKVKELVDQPGMETYKEKFNTDMAALDKTDPMLQSIAKYNKSVIDKIYAPLKENRFQLRTFISKAAENMDAPYYNILTQPDFSIFDTIKNITGIDFRFYDRAPINNPTATVVPIFTSDKAFNQYNKYITELQSLPNTAKNYERRIELSRALIAIIKEYEENLSKAISKLQQDGDIRNTGFKNLMRSIPQQMSPSAIAEGVDVFGERVSGTSQSILSEKDAAAKKVGEAAAATGQAIGSAASKTREAIGSAAAATGQAIGSAAAATGQAIGSAARKTREAIGSAAAATGRAAAATGRLMAEGVPALGSLTTAGPAGMSGSRTGGGGSRRRTIRSRK